MADKKEKKDDKKPEYILKPLDLMKTTVSQVAYSEVRRGPTLKGVSPAPVKKRPKKKDDAED